MAKAKYSIMADFFAYRIPTAFSVVGIPRIMVSAESLNGRNDESQTSNDRSKMKNGKWQMI